jgi:hypothetical protein
MSLTKFYHYNVWFEGDDGSRLNPRDLLTDEAFSNDIYQISNSDERSYRARFRNMGSHQYHGVIIRTKDEDDFVRLTSDGRMIRLSEATDDEGEAGDIDFDYVNFAVQTSTRQMDLLIEVGFQTPGIGVIKSYLNEHTEHDENYDIEHETDVRDVDDDKLTRLLDSSLKKVEISFKKNPQTYPELDADQAIRTLIDDSYRLKFEASLHQDKDADESRVDEFISHFSSLLGVDADTAEESISRIDFPRIMHTFRIEGIESDDEEIEDNLADIVKKEEIDTRGYELFDRGLGQELCDQL